ncbi:MAG: AAA-associated domain-containing protein, partial [Candidatus Bathyarchaeia archaeon]
KVWIVIRFQVECMIIKAEISQVIGLLELLKSYDGKMDIAALASTLRMEIDDLFPIIDTAEYFGLVATSEGDIQLTDVGYRLSESKLIEKKKILKNQLSKLEPFVSIIKSLQEKGELEREELIEILSSTPHRIENIDHFLNSVITLGSFSNIFYYNGDAKRIYLKRKPK